MIEDRLEIYNHLLSYRLRKDQAPKGIDPSPKPEDWSTLAGELALL
jgi:hypothetical protein